MDSDSWDPTIKSILYTLSTLSWKLIDCQASWSTYYKQWKRKWRTDQISSQLKDTRMFWSCATLYAWYLVLVSHKTCKKKDSRWASHFIFLYFIFPCRLMTNQLKISWHEHPCGLIGSDLWDLKLKSISCALSIHLTWPITETLFDRSGWTLS